MPLNRLDETWLRTVAQNALRQPVGERSRLIADFCRDPEISGALEETLDAYGEGDLETGGAIRGALWHDLMAVLGDDDSEAGDSEAGDPGATAETTDGGPAAASSEASPVPEGSRFGRLGRLRVERLLSSGGMGRVYEAYDELLERRVALKTLHGDHRLAPSARARFLREARLSSRLDHAHVCRLYDLVEDGGVEALVLELIEGQSLAERLASEPLDETSKMRIAVEMASGLAAAHEAGIVHRDLKPANVMLTQTETVKIVDFGIARSEETPQGSSASEGRDGFSAFKTRHGTTLGTLAYMSPEQASCESVGPASDIYSFGLVLREIFTGTKAYTFSNPAELWSKVAAGEVAGYEQIDARLRALIDRMLERDPSKRPTATELSGELTELSQPALSQPEPTPHRWLWGLAATFVMAVLLLLFFSRDQHLEPVFSDGETPRIVVLPIENRSGDDQLSWVSTGLSEMISESLEAADGLEIIEFAHIRELAGRLGPDATLDASLAAEALGANMVIEAALEPVSQGLYQLVYRLWRPGFTARSRVASGEDPFAAGAELAAAAIRRIAPQELLPDLREIFSADPFVNQLYALGVDQLRHDRGRAAEPFMRAVLELDESSIEARLGLADALNLQSDWSAAETVVDDIIRRTEGRPAILAEAFTARATSAHGRDQRREAAEWGEKAVRSAEAAGESSRLAAALHQLGRTLRYIDPPAAEQRFEEALALCRQTGQRLGEAKALHALGVVLDERGDPEGATEKFTEALEIARQLRAIRLEAIALDSLAIVSTQTGQFEVARDLFAQAVELHRRTGEPRALVFSLNNLGDMHQQLQDLGRAEATLLEAEAICQEIEAPNPCALLGFNFAELLLVNGRPTEALPLLERSEAFYGASDPDNVWLRSMHAALTQSLDAGRPLLESACAVVDAGRCQGYREGFADVEQRLAERERAP